MCVISGSKKWLYCMPVFMTLVMNTGQISLEKVDQSEEHSFLSQEYHHICISFFLVTYTLKKLNIFAEL